MTITQTGAGTPGGDGVWMKARSPGHTSGSPGGTFSLLPSLELSRDATHDSAWL